MIKDLVVHLGDTKTGSTSIQWTLVNGFWSCPGRDIVYPTDANHIGLTMTMTDPALRGRQAVEFETLATDFHLSKADHGIVSAETFEFVDPQMFRDAVNAYWPGLSERMRLIAYVRPHAGKLLSFFSERVKLGEDETSVTELFEKRSKERMFAYAPRFRKWRAVFGDRFELRVFDRKQLHDGDVVQDFFRYVLGDAEFQITGSTLSNASPTVSQLALLRKMHQTFNRRVQGNKPRVREAQKEMGRGIADYIQASGLGANDEKPKLPAALAERFVAHCKADAEALDAAFFEGSPMSTALERINTQVTETEQSLRAMDYFDADTIRAVQSFTGLLADVALSLPVQTKKAIDQGRIKHAARR